VSVRELLVWGGGAIVLRNVREPSEELRTPLGGDVHNPQRLAITRKAHQWRRVLKSDRHLADGEVERVGLRPLVAQKHAEEGEVELEACHAILLRNCVALAVPWTNRPTGRSPTARGLKQIT
jgi:hypothetical protein